MHAVAIAKGLGLLSTAHPNTITSDRDMRSWLELGGSGRGTWAKVSLKDGPKTYVVMRTNAITGDMLHGTYNPDIMAVHIPLSNIKSIEPVTASSEKNVLAAMLLGNLGSPSSYLPCDLFKISTAFCDDTLKPLLMKARDNAVAGTPRAEDIKELREAVESSSDALNGSKKWVDLFNKEHEIKTQLAELKQQKKILAQEVKRMRSGESEDELEISVKEDADQAKKLREALAAMDELLRN